MPSVVGNFGGNLKIIMYTLGLYRDFMPAGTPPSMCAKAPRLQRLFRPGCIYNNPGTTGLPSHPGSGIRCLPEGSLHVRGTIGGESDSGEQGGTWYEEGPYPIVSTPPRFCTAWFCLWSMPRYRHVD